MLLAGGRRRRKPNIWRATYSVSLLGLPIGTAGIVGEFDRNGYKIEANAKLTGLGDARRQRQRALRPAPAPSSRGRILPATYAVTAANSQMTRTMRMSLAGSAVTASIFRPRSRTSPTGCR